jgi:hypothetical protein
MRNAKWLVLLGALLACGLIAAGCGSDSSTSTVAAPTDTSSTTSDSSTTSSGDTSTTSSNGSTPDDVYNACIDAIKGTPAESAGQTACEQARSAFEQCAQQADSISDNNAHDLAVQACQDAADQTVAGLQAAG